MKTSSLVLIAFLIFLFIYPSDSANRVWLNGGATKGAGVYKTSLLDGPSSAYALNPERTGAIVSCKNQDDHCFVIGYDGDAESWYIDLNYVVSPPEPTDGTEEVYLDSQTGYYESRIYTP